MQFFKCKQARDRCVCGHEIGAHEILFAPITMCISYGKCLAININCISENCNITTCKFACEFMRLM